MNNKKLNRLIESKNLSMEEVELLPGYTRVQLGLPAIIPQVDYNFGQRLVENYLGRFQTLRTMFGLDDVVDIEPPFEFKEPDMGGNYSWYNAQMQFELNRRSVYHLVEEMDNYDVISAALDVYAEEATQTDEQTNRAVWIESADSNIQKELMSMLDRLGIEDNLFSIARSLCKYGDDFEQVIASSTQGIVSLQFINPNRLTRVEDRLGKLIGFAPGIHTDGQIHDERTIAKLRKSKPWDFVHFRLKSSRRETKHGETMLMAARRCWRQLKLLEDMLVLHRINRAADKDIYYIDVGTQSPAQQWQTVSRFIRELNRKFHVNPQTGQFRQEYWTRSVDEDVYLPIPRDGNTRVDRLQGANTADQIYDVDHFRNKLFAALKIPKAFLGFEESVSNKATLVSQDIRFARSIKRVQRSVKAGLQQLCRIHLALRGHDVINPDGTDKIKFRVNMSSINHIEQIARAETAQLQVDIATNLLTMATLGQGMNPESGEQTPGMIENVRDWTGWVLSKYLGLTDNEVEMFLPGAKTREPEQQVIRDIQDNMHKSGVSKRIKTLQEAKDFVNESAIEDEADSFEPYSGKEALKKASITKSWDEEGWSKSESKNEELTGFYDLEEEKQRLMESFKNDKQHVPDCPSCGAGLTQKLDEAANKPYFICSKNCGFIAFSETPYDQ